MSARYVYAVLSILGLTVAYACWCRAPLIWDGACQLNSTLIRQVPYHYLTRFHSYLLWWPTVWASRFTTNITALSTIFGLPFLLAPVAAVGISWWLVKNDAPHLIIWPIFGVCAGSLPGQIFVINDSIFQLNLFWPILVSVFVPLSPAKRIVLAMLVVFQFPHQLGVALFLGTAVAAAMAAAADAENRRRLVVRSLIMLSLFAVAASKLVLTNIAPLEGEMPTRYFQTPHRDMPGMIFATAGALLFVVAVAMSCRWWWSVICLLLAAGLIVGLDHVLHARKELVDGFLDTYAEQEAGWTQALNDWGSGVKGWPIRGLYFMWVSGLLVLIHRTRQKLGPAAMLGTVKIGLYAIALAAVGFAFWFHWASDGQLWWKALDYRRWVGPLTLPFFFMLTLEACFTARQRRKSPAEADLVPAVSLPNEQMPLRGPLALLLASTFAVVIGLQCTIWHNVSGRLFDEVMHHSPASDVIVSEDAFPWMHNTSLDHWAIKDFIILLQGKKPTRLLLEPDDIKNMSKDPPQYPSMMSIETHHDPGPQGWFDIHDILHAIKAGG